MRDRAMLATDRLPQQQTFAPALLRRTGCWRKVGRLQPSSPERDLHVLSRRWLDWQMSRSQRPRQARSAFAAARGGQRQLFAHEAAGTLPRHAHARCAVKQVTTRPRQYRACEPRHLRPDRDLERDRAFRPSIIPKSIAPRSPGFSKRASAASISGFTIQMSCTQAPTV
jgi:hypothetical protein